LNETTENSAQRQVFLTRGVGRGALSPPSRSMKLPCDAATHPTGVVITTENHSAGPAQGPENVTYEVLVTTSAR
jgi:hypothetical protein